MKKIIFLLLSISSISMSFAKEGGGNVKASLTNVTVFRVGAELNHIARADLLKGNNELVIDNISNTLDANSIQVNCSGNVTVMGIEFSTDYLQQETKTPAILILEDSIESINASLKKIRTNAAVMNDLLAVLKANKEIKGSQTGLSVTELIKLMDYYKNKSLELQEELAGLSLKENKTNTQLAKLNQQLLEEQKKNTKTAGRLVLQLNCSISGKYDFAISYITRNAYWTPFYDLRSDNIKSPLKLVYRAKIFQTTGIDWKQVKLSLSTSTPSQTGTAPLFSTWFLSYVNPVNYYNNSLGLQGKAAGVSNSLNEVVVVGYGTADRDNQESLSKSEDNPPLYIVNGAEMLESEYRKIRRTAIKNVEVLKNAAASSIYGSRAANGAVIVTLKDGLDDYITVSDKELNVTFDIELPYDVPTNGKAQTAVLKEEEVKANYKFYGVPKLDKDVFLLAEIADWENLNLLPGEANIIFEGTYIGKSFIDPSSTQDTLNITMGRDKRVVIKKEKLVDYSSVKFLGSNKKQTFTYEITVKNNKKDEINILVKDQYPISQDKDIDVELLERSEATNNEETGVLTWKLKLAPGEVKKLRVSYSVRYPKDKILNL